MHEARTVDRSEIGGDDEAGTRSSTIRKRAHRIAHLTDRWYVACSSHELRSRPLAVTILGVPLVLFRARSGRPGALLDRCAHRNAPLALGRVCSEHLACRYHGWEFDADGECRKVPALAGESQAAARRVPSFAVREQQGLIWVFAQADTAPQVEPYSLPHHDDRSFGRFELRYRVDATLHATLENMLDVPHTSHLHRGLFRGGDPRRLQAVVRRRADRVEAEYVGEPLPTGLAARVLGLGASPDATMEHFDRFIMPSISQVEYGLGNSRFVATSLLTPESDFVTRFRTVVSYRLPIPSALLRLVFTPIAMRILGQDARMVAQQTRNVRRFGQESYASTSVDVLGAEIWRLLERGERGLDGGEPLERELELLV